MSPAALSRRLSTAAVALLLAACGGSTDGSPGAALFVKSLGGPLHDGLQAAVETPDGGYVLVGEHGGFGSRHQTVGTRAWITKTDDLGDVEWSRLVAGDLGTPGAGGDESLNYREAEPRPGGGFYLAGTRTDWASLDPVGQLTDVELTRLDEQGNQIWSRTLEVPLPNGDELGPGASGTRDTPTALSGASDGGVLIAGSSAGLFGLDGVFATTQYSWVMKVDDGGDLEWFDVLTADLPAGRRLVGSQVLVEVAGDGAVYGIESTGSLLFTGNRDYRTRVVRWTAEGARLWESGRDGLLAVEAATAPRTTGPDDLVLIGIDVGELIVISRRRALGLAASDGGELFYSPLDMERAGAVVAADSGDPSGAFLFAAGRETNAPQPFSLGFEWISDSGQELDGLDSTVGPFQAVLNGRIVDGPSGPRFEFLALRPQVADAGVGQPQGLVRVGAAAGGGIDSIVDLGVTAGVTSRYRSNRSVGWMPGSDRFWTWDGADGEAPRPGGARLRLFEPDGTEVWSRPFGPSASWRLDRALDVELLVDPAAPEAWELAVLAQVTVVEGDQERLRPWFLRFDREGQLLTQTRFEGVEFEALPTNTSASWTSRQGILHNASGLLTRAADGNFLAPVVSDDRTTRVLKWSLDGTVLWCSGAVSDQAAIYPRSLVALDDGGAMVAMFNGLCRIDPAGQILWRRRYGDSILLNLAPTQDGNLLLLRSGVDAQFEWRQPDGSLIRTATVELPPYGLTPEGSELIPTSEGGFVLLSSRLERLPQNSEGIGLSDSGMLEVLKIDAEGRPVWRSVFGGLLDEAANSLQETGDGGLLIAGRTRSITDSMDGWLLRLDSCGRSGSACVAEWMREGSEIGFSAAPVGADPFETVSVPAPFDSPIAVASTPTTQSVVALDDLLVTRSCSAISKDDPAPPLGSFRSLTITVAAGSGTVAQVVDGGGGFTCSDTCTFAFPAGTTVELAAVPAPGFGAPVWTGGDCPGGASLDCSVTLDEDRTVSVEFPTENDTSVQYDLDIQFVGAGSGRLVVDPPGLFLFDSAFYAGFGFAGEQHFFTATPDPGSSFGGFTGLDSADGNVGELTFVASDRTVTVRFD